MKKILYIAIFSFLFISCEDDLDQKPISDIGANNFYSNTDDFENAINGT